MNDDSASFHPGVEPPEGVETNGGPAEDSLIFAFRGDRLVVSADPGGWRLPSLGQMASGGEAPVYLGTYAERACFGIELDPAASLPAGFRAERLRDGWQNLPDPLFAAAGFAWQIVHWNATHRFCGRCATRTAPLPGERAKKCPGCGHVAYPRLSPAVIVLVRQGDKILLARPQNASYVFYSTLAGFVEPGESLEEAVAREIHEEAGIRVGELRYFASQPWPYPHSLMIGFFARHLAGELRFEPKEIADGGFYALDELPPLPSPLSIARWLIDAAIAEIEAGR